MHLVRRGHLYFGLFLVPWVLLYGVTGFLFNHPTAFADAPTASFGRDELIGTPFESPPAPVEVADRLVAVLNARANPPVEYRLVEPEKAKYTREFAFATVKTDDRELNVLIDVTGAGGTVRSRPQPPAAPSRAEKAPFAIGGGRPSATAKGGGPRPVPPAATPLVPEVPLPEWVKATVPVVLERTGFPSGEVTVTSVPDLTFQMADPQTVWTVTYNALTGTVTGRPTADAPPPEELSTRRFLTRLHLTHGFPSSPNARWFWAVIVDAMAFVMVFWGVSGLFMWWQIKATRKLGFLVLVLSLAAATALGFGMHEVFTTR
jgi:hypothetical protein